MNRISPDLLDPRTDSELRALDPAAPLTAEDRIRAEARLAQIVATDPAAPSTVPTPARALPLRRRAAVRWASAAAALAAVTTAGLALSTVGAPAAYATWTATPAQVAAADNAVFEKACREQTGEISWLGDATLSVRLAERRGDYVAMLLTGNGTNQHGPTNASVTCVGMLPVGGRTVKDLASGVAGGSAAEGYDPANAFKDPSGAQFYEGSMSTFTMGANWLGQGGEPASMVDGQVGPDVVKMTIHSSIDGTSAEASIKDGTYAAWWPGSAFDLSGEAQPSGEGGPEPQLTYDLVLKDGTVLTDVTPTRPTN